MARASSTAATALAISAAIESMFAAIAAVGDSLGAPSDRAATGVATTGSGWGGAAAGAASVRSEYIAIADAISSHESPRASRVCALSCSRVMSVPRSTPMVRPPNTRREMSSRGGTPTHSA